MTTKKLGTVNGYVDSHAWVNNGPAILFNGTLTGLGESIRNAGVKIQPGDVVLANFGGRRRDYADTAYVADKFGSLDRDWTYFTRTKGGAK